MRLFLLAFSFSCLSLLSFSQPINDDCGGIIDLGEAPICPIPDTFNNVNATESIVFSDINFNIPVCFNGGTVDKDVWFMFTVPSNGSVIDFTVTVTGIEGPNGMMVQPQLAIYRGECLLDELQELDCVTSPLGATEVEIDLLGLTPGLPYFLRINDWSASATPNWGDFQLCVAEYIPIFNMGDEPGSSSCFGTLYDSGGPDGDYNDNENLSFTICPNDFFECLFINVEDFNTEPGIDDINFFAGSDIFAPQIASINGAGGGFEVQAASDCVTVQFTSDFSVTNSGFELTWQCSPDSCTIPPLITCDDPINIPSLPFFQDEISTCFAGNTVTTGPCGNDGFIDNDEYIFTYDSPGDECINVNITGSNIGTGVAIYNDCPNVASDCVAVAGGGFGAVDPTINGAFLEEAGTYYIVIANNNNCTPFEIMVETVTCPIVFPSAALCEDAFSLNGCSGGEPAIISVAPGEGEPGFIEPGVNLGCWGAFFPLNFTWFFFQAQEDGNFGFTMQSDDPAEASDIDFHAWGPFDDPADACNFIENNEPIRSSYAAGADPTGLADIHPVLGTPVTDVCEDAGGDDFVSTIPVLAGEYYFVLVNDWGGQIVSGAVQMDFDQTTAGVLNGIGESFSISNDTAACPGEDVLLVADGGEVYQWFPTDGLSCVNCPDPVATITESMTYSVAVFGICDNDTLSVDVGFLEVDAGPDLEVCQNEEIQLLAGSNFSSIGYEWDGPAGTLSCTDCPDPFVTGINPGTFEYSVTITGPTCAFSDVMELTVIDSPAPEYEINDDQQLCFGESADLGGAMTPGVSYSWTSLPAGFTSSDPNPNVDPTETTTYYLEIMNALCPNPSFDSIQITVSELPIIETANDTIICLDESTQIGNVIPQNGVTYNWFPPTGLDDFNSPNPIATPANTTTYTLTASRDGCIEQSSITVEVVEISVALNNPDTLALCLGDTIDLNAVISPAGIPITWSNENGTIPLAGLNVNFVPQNPGYHYASVEVGGCVKIDSVYIGIDSLPVNLDILPADTTICQGEMVTLVSETYDPAIYQEFSTQWLTANGMLTPDSLFNLVVQPTETTTYARIVTNGFCSAVQTATVEVITVESVTIEPQNPQICPGESVQLTASADQPVTFTWDPPSSLSCEECPDPIATPTSSTTYNVEADFSGCPVMASVSVEVIPLPTIQFPTPIICLGDDITLNLDPNPTYQYSWTSTDPAFGTSDEAAPNASPTETNTYYVTVDNGICAPLQDSITVEVSGEVNLSINEDGLICEGQSFDLFADAGISGNYTWQPAGSLSCENCQDPIATPTETTLYAVEFINQCTTLTATVTINVAPGINITDLTHSNPTDTVYQGTEVILTVNSDPAAFSYEWSTGGTEATTIVAPLDPPSATYSVTVTDDLGCTDTESITLEVLMPDFEIPNAFSPGNDDINNLFNVVIFGENISVRSIHIYNRWGQNVYQENNTNNGWDGLHDGKPAPSDVYVYSILMIMPDGSEKLEKGDLTLLR